MYILPFDAWFSCIFNIQSLEWGTHLSPHRSSTEEATGNEQESPTNYCYCVMNNTKGPLPPPKLTRGNAAKVKGTCHLGGEYDISVCHDMAAGALEPNAGCIAIEGLSNEAVSFQVNKIFCLLPF